MSVFRKRQSPLGDDQLTWRQLFGLYKKIRIPWLWMILVALLAVGMMFSEATGWGSPATAAAPKRRTGDIGAEAGIRQCPSGRHGGRRGSRRR